MPVDASTPVPDELDARVEQMLAHMDRVHAEVVNRLDGAADEQPAPSTPAQVPATPNPPADLDQEVARALSKAEQAAQSTSNGADVPSATIKQLDEQLASTVSVEAPPEDEFADGSSMVEGLSLDVPLPDSSPLELPKIAPPEASAPAASASVTPPSAAQAPVAVAPAAAPAEPVAPAPMPVPAPAKPQPAPAPSPAPAAKPPAPKPSEPAKVKPAAVAKPSGPTIADRFWKVATPVIEPFAVRLGKLPVGFQHTVGWIGVVTLFMAAATWGYVIFFQETRQGSHIPVDDGADHAAAEGHAPDAKASGEAAHGEKKAAPKGEHPPEKAAETTNEQREHVPGKPAKPDSHSTAPAEHEEPKAGGH